MENTSYLLSENVFTSSGNSNNNTADPSYLDETQFLINFPSALRVYAEIFNFLD